jgi:thiamine biosynthesis lipoprotein
MDTTIDTPRAPLTPRHLRVEHIMGMPIGIDVRAPAIDPAAFEAAFDWLRWVDATFSTYRPDSAINRINRRELAEAEAHPYVGAVLARCRALARETDGYFDMRVAIGAHDRRDDAVLALGAVDPSGLVKGWAVDRAGVILEAAGVRSYSINAGGDIRVRGGAAPGAPWRIGIQHPLQRDKVAAVLTANDLAVATSGAYERGAHIVDPHTGRPPEGVLSVTVVGPELATADAYATAAYARGPAGPAWTARLADRGYEALTILADGTVRATPGVPLAR